MNTVLKVVLVIVINSYLSVNFVNAIEVITKPLESVANSVLDKCVLNVRDVIVFIAIIAGMVGFICIIGTILCMYKWKQAKKGEL